MLVMDTTNELVSQTAAGTPIRLVVSPGSGFGPLSLSIEIPGRLKLMPCSKPFRLEAPIGGSTHAVRAVAANAKVGLTATEAARIESWVQALDADYSAAPEVVAVRLRALRADIRRKIEGCLEEAQERRTRAWESGDERRGVTDNAWDRRAEEARAELAAFDTQHPEIAAEPPAYVTDLNSFYNRALRGED